MLQVQDPRQLFDQDVVGPDGEKLGRVKQVLVDDATGQPEFVAVRTGLFGMRESVIPVARASFDGGLHVPYDKGTIKDAPHIEHDGDLSEDDEQQLYSYYGIPYGDSASPTGLPESGATGHSTTAPSDTGTSGRLGGTDDAMTRSEEQLHVGKEEVETGRARLRKYVVTEPVQQTVPVTHEEVRVEREPITDENAGAAMSGPDISEAEHETVLHAEKPVVAKETVPVERVRMTTDEVTDEAEIDESVRKERIEGPDEG